ncbi:MAG: hypothetical protein ACAI38_23430 [Myxococcota bacterium]|nr:hypothetical protein [Myxococcota bacterium]
MTANIRAIPLPSRNDPAVVAARENIDGVLRGAYNASEGTIPLSAAAAMLAKLREGDDVITDEEAFAVISLLQDTRDSTPELETRFRELRAQIQAHEHVPGMADRIGALRVRAAAVEAQLNYAYAQHSPLSQVYRAIEDDRRGRIN